MSFLISDDRKTITCGICGMTSHHPDDVSAHYCGKCKIFHDDEARICHADDCTVLLVRILGKLPMFCWDHLPP